MNESIFVDNRKQKVGYTMVTMDQMIEAQPLPAGTSSQKAEFIALTYTLKLAKRK